MGMRWVEWCLGELPLYKWIKLFRKDLFFNFSMNLCVCGFVALSVNISASVHGGQSQWVLLIQTWELCKSSVHSEQLSHLSCPSLN